MRGSLRDLVRECLENDDRYRLHLSATLCGAPAVACSLILEDKIPPALEVLAHQAAAEDGADACAVLADALEERGDLASADRLRVK